MCVEVFVGDKLCRTRGELVAALRGPVVPDGPATDWPDNCCLCPLDIDATALKYGYATKSDGLCVEFVRLGE
jgi:hypothetical protein